MYSQVRHALVHWAAWTLAAHGARSGRQPDAAYPTTDAPAFHALGGPAAPTAQITKRSTPFDWFLRATSASDDGDPVFQVVGGF